MKRIFLIAAVLAGGVAASQAGVSIGIGIGLPLPAVVAPAPVCPPVVVEQPAVVVPSPIVVGGPIWGPGVVVGGPVYRRYGYYHDYRWHDLDRNHYGEHDRGWHR
jgi:hypothetical protein